MQIPIVAVNVASKGYDFARAVEFMQWIDSALDRANPGASRVLTDADISLTSTAYKLSQVIPKYVELQYESYEISWR